MRGCASAGRSTSPVISRGRRPARSSSGCRAPEAGGSGVRLRLVLVVPDVGGAEVVLRRALERAALDPGLPGDHLLDLPGEREVAVGNPLGCMVLQADF